MKTIGLAILAGALWLLAVPFTFVVLYSVIELQSAARAASVGDGRLADLQVVALAKNIQRDDAAMEASIARIASIDQQMARIRQSLDKDSISLQVNRGTVRALTLETAAQFGFHVNQSACTASPAILEDCAAKHNDVACATDWSMATACYYQVLGETRSYKAGDRTALASRLSEIETAVREARKAGFAFNQDAKTFNGFVHDRNDEAARLAQLQEARSAAAKSNPLVAVAEGFLRLDGLPILVALFILPPGVSVALFTALMGAIGSMVSSLSSRFVPGERGRSSGAQVAFIDPVVGALAGFTVFFVVSAGAAFLVQPGPKGAIDAINNLSPPALASLGIFAGLAADQAIAWLRTRARGFFKV
jgi:hypothetical protein